MLLGLPPAAARVIGRGVIILILSVAVGVTAVESQLNQLTGSRDFVEVLNVRRDAEGGYRAYFFGRSGTLKAVFPVGRIAGDSRAITVGAGDMAVTMSAVLRADCSPAFYWLGEWRRQFVAAAFRTKQEFARYCEELKPLVRRLAGVVGR